MTDTELFEIVKDHRYAWPRDVGYAGGLYSFEYATEKTHVLFETDHAVMLFESSFHQTLVANTDYVHTTRHNGGAWYAVQVCDRDFEAPTLIEAYALALEWMK